MILVDTSVWIAHLRVKDPVLSRLLEAGQVLMHPFILGELACGNLQNRDVLLSNFATLRNDHRSMHVNQFTDKPQLLLHLLLRIRNSNRVDRYTRSVEPNKHCRLFSGKSQIPGHKRVLNYRLALM